MFLVLRKYIILLIYYLLLNENNVCCQQYDVHWFRETTAVVSEGNRKSVDIYCYPGTEKNILALWQTIKFNIRMKDANADFQLHIGTLPELVYEEFVEKSYGWSVNPFQRKSPRSVNIDLFNTTCMAVNTKEKHRIDFHIIRIDIWRVLLTVLGITTIYLSKTLSSNSLFYYLCGILVGVCASFMVLVYYVSKFLPRKTLTYSILIGGWTVGVYIFQQIWENIRTIMLSYQNYVFWYSLIVGFCSFLICYKIGPPTTRRSQNLVMWTLQLVGSIMIFFSSDYQEASTGILFVTLFMKYFQHSIARFIMSYWRRKFPPKRKLLSSEEYYEQGARETKEALENLRKYCSSPDCAQWKIMLKLNDSQRFASFVEGNSHLSDDEVLDYEYYAFSSENQRRKYDNSAVNHLEISDDSSQSDISD